MHKQVALIHILFLFGGLHYYKAEVYGPPGIPDMLHTFSDSGENHCDKCIWTSKLGAVYDLSPLCEHHYTVKMHKPRAGQIMFGVCDQIPCSKASKAMACIFIPGNTATVSGQNLKIEALEENIPSAGVRLLLEDGEFCVATNRRRHTYISLKCDKSASSLKQLEAWEGEGSDICIYYISFSTSHACPQSHNRYTQPQPKVTAISGCTNAVPRHSITDCPAHGGAPIIIHGVDFLTSANLLKAVEVKIGRLLCENVQVVDRWSITCRLPSGTGQKLQVQVQFKVLQQKATTLNEIVISSSLSEASVSYKPLVDYLHQFSNFQQLGVGGLAPQIKQLYQRAFASRGVPGSVLKQLGIEHAKGILLYGPPGSGKTLLARTIAQILHTDHVTLINAPEIMSKFLGESEKNLRGHFEEAGKAWHELGEASDLYVIIIDEIDAICKQRGKSDTSAAAAAYDSVVNQLLTLMDGLKELHNILVIGMTNRKELIDPALLRPGRFEIHIEIGLPDENGRWEIFYIHTESMQKHNLLAADVDLHELAANTSQYSGAEIAGLVRLAASYALDRSYRKDEQQPLLVERMDFERALLETHPAYTQKRVTIMKEFMPRGFISCGPANELVHQELKRISSNIQSSHIARLDTVLLYGPRGTGKSAMAVELAIGGSFSYIKVISPRLFMHLTTQMKFDLLSETFFDAFKSDFSLVILDDLHFFLEVVQIGKEVHASQLLLNQLGTLLASAHSKLLVIATVFCSTYDLYDSASGQLELQYLFKNHYYMAPLNPMSIMNALRSVNLTATPQIKMADNVKIPLSHFFIITDCLDLKLDKSGSLLTQTIWDECYEDGNSKTIVRVAG